MDAYMITSTHTHTQSEGIFFKDNEMNKEKCTIMTTNIKI